MKDETQIEIETVEWVTKEIETALLQLMRRDGRATRVAELTGKRKTETGAIAQARYDGYTVGIGDALLALDKVRQEYQP